MKKFALALLLLLAPMVANATTVSVIPPDTTVALNSEFTLTVATDGLPDLLAFQFIYHYDPTLLEFLGAEPGNLLTDPYVFWAYPCGPDSIWYDAANLGHSVSGPGVLVYLHFRTIGMGQSWITCPYVDFRDSHNNKTFPTCGSARVMNDALPTWNSTWGRVKVLWR